MMMAKGYEVKKKDCKLSPQQCLKISIGRLNSPIIQAKKAETKRRKELEKQIREQNKAEEIQRRGYVLHSPESRLRLSETHKGLTPWNKGVKAWNNGISWPAEVKQNISRGMTVYWMVRKQTATTVEPLP